jgi:hypothetical protein
VVPGSRNCGSFKKILVAIAATATATAATTVFATTTATTASGAFFTWSGNVYRQIATVELLAVHGFNGLLRLFGRAHGNKAETAGAASRSVHHQIRLNDRSVRGKGVLQIVFRGIEGEVSNKQFIAHVMSYCPELTVAFTRLIPTIGFKIITEPSSPEDSPCLKVTSNRTECLRMTKFKGIATGILDFFRPQEWPQKNDLRQRNDIVRTGRHWLHSA